MEHKPLIENSPKDGFMRKGSMRRSAKSSVAAKCDKNSNNLSDETDKEMTTDSCVKAKQARDFEHLVNSHITKSGAVNNDSFLKKYDDDVSKPKSSQFESTDDWYASASDFEDSDGAVSKSYGYNAVNPVLECVNQVSFSIG